MNHDLASQFLRPYLSNWLIQQIGAPDLQPGMVHTCDATILYADLSGFTRLTAAFASLPDGAERLHDSLTRFFDALIDTIIAHGGDVAAIAGDALTAWWPDRVDSDIARRCGAAMVLALNALPAITTPQGLFRLDLRIGVSAGMTHVALAGLPSHGLHLILSGPAIDAATSAEQLAAPGTIHLAEAQRLAGPATTSIQPSEPQVSLSWEHFLPPTFAERLRYHDLVAEYRRCVPAFAAFALPGRPEALHPLVAQAQAVVLRWGGWLNEVEVGDKGAVFVMLFGAPVARGDDTSRAVGCCLELHERGLIDRAAVTVGILFLGAVGSRQRRVYTAQGDDMNLAAHLMYGAAPGEVLVSGRVRSDILGRYQTGAPTLVVTKGHREGVPVARVLAAGARVGRGVALQRYISDSAALIGRDEERQLLGWAAERAAAGAPGLILLEGESGIGKSFVLQDLAAAWVARGRRGYSSECSSGGQGSALLAWQPILADICGIDEGAGLHVQRAQLAEALAAVPEADAQASQSLAVALGLGGQIPAEQPLDPQRLIDLAVALISAQLRDGPLLIVIEDIHWADDLSLRLATNLLWAVPPGDPFPLCLALSHRPLDGEVPPAMADLRAFAGATRVTLGRLTSDQSVELIRTLLGVSDVEPDLRQHVERHTEGQPLFIKEYLRVLRQHSLAEIRDDMAYMVPSAPAVQVSNSAQGVIQARVDRLDEPTRLTLKVAAVIGRSFPLRLLETIHPAQPSDPELRKQLDVLSALTIVELELEDPEPVYRFKYGITHEVAYTSLLFGQRRQLHAAVAAWYERSYAAEIASGVVVSAVYDLLIDHLRRADERERQAHYCRVAAGHAARRFASAAALRYIEQALVVTSDPAERYDLLLLRVAINERIGNQVPQADDIAAIEQLAAQLGDQLRQAYATYYRLRYLLAIGMRQVVQRTAQATDLLLRQVLRRASGPLRRQALLLRAGCLDARGVACAEGGDLAQAQLFHRRALTICWAETAADRQAGPAGPAWQLDAQALATRCLSHLGEVALHQRHVDQALRCYEQALSLARSAGDWGSEARARAEMSRAYLAQGDLATALAYGDRALATSHAVGDRTGQAMALRQLAAISADQGDYAEAQRRCWHALSISASMHARVLEAQILQDISDFATAQGMDEDAEAARLEAERVRRQWWEPPAEPADQAAIGSL